MCPIGKQNKLSFGVPSQGSQRSVKRLTNGINLMCSCKNNVSCKIREAQAACITK